MPPNAEIEFVKPRLDIEVSTIAIVMLVVFGVLLLINLAYTLRRYWGMCTSDYRPASQASDSTGFSFEESEAPLDEETTVLRRLSFEYKFQTYLC